MKNCSMKSILSLAVAGSMATALTWSNDTHACAAESYTSAVCIMAIPWTNLSGYMPANGAVLNVSNYQALFSLIGITYGGNGSTTFQLPDLRGRVVIGAGTGGSVGNYNVGAKGGAITVMLTPANVPLLPHSHSLTTGQGGVVVTGAIGTLTATTTLTGLTATTTLNNVTATAAGSGLTLKGYSGNAGTGSASGAALATPTSPSNKIYSATTPDVSMIGGSISGTAPVTFTGNPTTTVTGNPTTTLSGAPTVMINGMTGAAAASATQAVNILPPYLAMNYFIATEGIYPPRD